MPTDYTSQINAIQQSVTYTNASAGDLAVYNAELNNGSSLAQVAQQIVNSSYVTSVVDPVIALYQGAFGRVPDAAGLKAEVQAVEAGVPLAPRSATDNSSLVFQFANSPEFTQRYGVTALSPSSPALVQLLYQNVLGRAPDAAGLAYWTAQPLNAQQLLAAFSLPNLDPEYAARVSQQVKSFEYDETGQAGSQPVPTMGSLFQVPVNQGATNGPGSSFQFTTALDNLQGTNGNDTFTGDNTNGGTTVTAGDSANGGAGTDTFNYFVGANAVIPQLTSIEVVNFVGGAANQTFDISNATGVTNANLKNETVGGQTVIVANGTAIGFDNVKYGAGGDIADFAVGSTTGTVTLSNGSVLGTAANGGTLQIATVGGGAAPATINLVSTGSAANSIGGLLSAGTTTLNITADQNLTIGGNLSTSVNTIDGSSATGALKFALGATTATTDSVKTGSGADFVDISTVGADSVTVALGAGNDTLKVAGALGTFTVGTSLDGGDGTDIINLTGTFTAANIAQVKNFETLDVSGSGAVTYDASLATGTGAFKTFQADANINGTFTAAANGNAASDLDHGALTFQNAASGFTFSDIALKGTDTTGTSLTVTLANATGTTDATTLNLVATDGNNDGTVNGKFTLGTYTATGIENVTINSSVNGIDTGHQASDYTNTITTLTDNNLTTLTITGNAGLTVTTALANVANGDTTAANLTTVNAGGETGAVTLNYAAATHAVQYTGSSGIDTITTSGAGGGVYGAGGNDQITLSAANSVDTLFYKAGTDAQLATTAGTGNVPAGATVETITNFVTTNAGANAHDTIDLSGIGGFTGVARGVSNIGVAVDPTAGNFSGNQAGFFNTAGGNVGVVLDVVAGVNGGAGSTYVFVDANHDGNFNAATDLVIKLAGVTNVSASDFNFG